MPRNANKAKKPASAANASNLLESSGLAAAGFIGFDSFSNQLDANQPSKAQLGVSVFYSGSDNELSTIFKNVSKKDTITKIKALEQLEAVLQQKSSKEIRACLSHWFYVYGLLNMENNKRIRELTAKVLFVFVEKTPKALRRNIGALLGHWFCSCFDSEKEVAHIR